jgi:hypothetical protein
MRVSPSLLGLIISAFIEYLEDLSEGKMRQVPHYFLDEEMYTVYKIVVKKNDAAWGWKREITPFI